MGPGKTQYTTKYARNAVFDKVLIKNDFPCISQFVSLLFELLLNHFEAFLVSSSARGVINKGTDYTKRPAEKRKTDNVA